MMAKVFLFVVSVVGVLALGLGELFSFVGVQFGWWAVPVFVPVLVWLVVSALARRVLRPVELDGWRWWQRLRAAVVLVFVLWVVWGWWAGPVARAWKHEHGGLISDAPGGGPRYPLHAVLAASPVLMGFIVFLVLALGMVLAPNIRRRDWEPPRPPGGPEPLRAPLLNERARPPRPRHWP